MAKLTVDVDGHEKVIRKIKRDLHRGMDKSARRLASIGKEESRHILEMHDRIFNREVYRKFRTVYLDDSPAHVRVSLTNYAEHSGAVEHGVSPAEYADGGPPVEALLPWVARKLQGKGGNVPSGGPDGGDPDYDDTAVEDDDVDAGSDTLKEASGTATAGEPLSRGDIIDVHWEDGSVDRDWRVYSVVDEKTIKTGTDGNSEFIDLDGDQSYKHPDTIVKNGTYDEIYVESGDRVESDLGIEGEVLEVRDTEVDIEFEDAGGTYVDTVSRSKVRYEYQFIDENRVDSLTFSKHADDLALDTGNLDETPEELAKRVVRNVDSFHTINDLTRVETIVDGKFSQLEDAFDNPDTITVPQNLFEESDWLDVYESPYIKEKNADSKWFAVSQEEYHVQYLVEHQYGRYLWDNLSPTGKDEFRKRWSFTETDTGWKLPEDADDISGYAAEGEAEFFAEAFVKRDTYNFREQQKQEYFEDITGLNADYFEDSFLEKDRSSTDYVVGIDYPSGGEAIRENDLRDFEGQTYTTHFNPDRYESDFAYKDGMEYVFTSEKWDGARVLTWREKDDEGIPYVTDFNGRTYSLDEVTLQGVQESEVLFNNVEDHDQFIVDVEDHFNVDVPGEYAYVTYKKRTDRPWQADVLDSEETFSDDVIQLDPATIIGTREDNPDLWANGIDTLDPVESADLDDNLVTDLPESEIEKKDVNRAQRIGSHVIVNDDGDQYRAESAGYDYDGNLKSLKITEDGERKTWDYDYDDPSANDISIDYVPRKVSQYKQVQEGDDIIVDPDAMDGDSYFTDSKYRASVEFVSSVSGKPRVRPFGTSTSEYDEVPFDSFIEGRETVDGWDAHNWDKGRSVTVEYHGGTVTGRLQKTESQNYDDKNYELSQMSLETEERGSFYFDATEVVDSENDADEFYDQWYDFDRTIDHSISEWKDYDGEVTLNDLEPKEFDPLDGAGDLDVGTQITYDVGGNSGVTKISSAPRADGTYYNTEEGYTISDYETQITNFDGAGSTADELDEGMDVSTGDRFGEIIEQTDTGGVYVDFDGDGEWDDLLDPDQVVPVPKEIPEGAEVMFWSHREGELKTGTVRFKVGNTINIKDEDRRTYKTDNEALYPAKIIGYQV